MHGLFIQLISLTILLISVDSVEVVLTELQAKPSVAKVITIVKTKAMFISFKVGNIGTLKFLQPSFSLAGG